MYNKLSIKSTQNRTKAITNTDSNYIAIKVPIFLNCNFYYNTQDIKLPQSLCPIKFCVV